jgi:hypothetical protein
MVIPIQPVKKKILEKICDYFRNSNKLWKNFKLFKKTKVYKASNWEIGFICVSKKKAEILYKDELRHNNNNLKLNDDQQQI